MKKTFVEYFLSDSFNKKNITMKWIHNLLKGAALTSVLFIFQACYGTPEWLHDADVTFKVVSAEDDKPIKDVEIFTRVHANENLDWNLCGYTDEEGTLGATVGYDDESKTQFRFQDKDGAFEIKDTVVVDLSNTIVVKLRKAE